MGIGVKADTDLAFANRVVARDRIEHRKLNSTAVSRSCAGTINVLYGPLRGIGVEADTLFAFANRVVARDRIERRKHRLDRHLALHGRNHETLFEGGQRREPEDRLYLGRD